RPSRRPGDRVRGRRTRPATVDHRRGVVDLGSRRIHADADPDARRARRSRLCDQDSRAESAERAEDRHAGRRAAHAEPYRAMTTGPATAPGVDAAIDKRVGPDPALEW